MSTVTRLEKAATTIMTPLVDGGYEPYTIEGTHLWRCDWCGLVWDKRWHAETCESRGHVAVWKQGIPRGRTLHYYERRAVRRDPPMPVIPLEPAEDDASAFWTYLLTCPIDHLEEANPS